MWISYLHRRVTNAAVRRLALCLCLLGGSLPACATPEDASTLDSLETVRVEHVVDGDTLVVTTASGRRESVRLLGVDTPELHHRARPTEFYAAEARAFVEQRIAGQQVRLGRDSLRDNDRDRYDRLLRYVYLPDGNSLNAELLRTGHAYAYTRFPLTENDRYLALEAEARRAGRGVWAEGGLAEIAWNRKQGIRPYVVHPMTNRSWAIEYGPFILTHVRSNRLAGELNRLVGWITEYRGEHLDRQLLENGYVRTRSNGN